MSVHCKKDKRIVKISEDGKVYHSVQQVEPESLSRLRGKTSWIAWLALQLIKMIKVKTQNGLRVRIFFDVVGQETH
jgi:hypothetical protein